jgi:hypothetical protein
MPGILLTFTNAADSRFLGCYNSHSFIGAHPNIKLSDFVKKLKTVTSRLARKYYGELAALVKLCKIQGVEG